MYVCMVMYVSYDVQGNISTQLILEAIRVQHNCFSVSYWLVSAVLYVIRNMMLTNFQFL